MGKHDDFKTDEFLGSLIEASQIEESILNGTLVEREALSIEDPLEKSKGLQPVDIDNADLVAPRNYHYHEKIHSVCKPWCGKDYGGSGGNCAHYAANADLWNIKAGSAGISYRCPSGYAINAHQMFEHCKQLSGAWDFSEYAQLKNRGLAFGWNKDGTRVVHVGVYAGWTGNYDTEWVYHYGFNSGKVIRNTARWWATNSTWGYHSFFERK